MTTTLTDKEQHAQDQQLLKDVLRLKEERDMGCADADRLFGIALGLATVGDRGKRWPLTDEKREYLRQLKKRWTPKKGKKL